MRTPTEAKYTGVNLKRKRERLLLTQPELAKEIGVSVWSISMWEQGKKKPSLRHLRSLVTFFESKKES